ncbi:Calcium ATPase transmembrane domain M-containing protein [Mycena indigotica]|uniref:D-serine dehydratase n=1 Tax=Mycena indigotica TaxID=2126181 RepID=A0A8H6RZI9_9AGAR|nr:Calcium ATPase transmembrane domain M-containing protein [Mycena indigotica]KAF7289881.1 Calcium ATPase transmembrane domain M-containing protein [Mycena indigotica]
MPAHADEEKPLAHSESVPARSRELPGVNPRNVAIEFGFSLLPFGFLLNSPSRYRTISIHVDTLHETKEKNKEKQAAPVSPATAISGIDVHLLGVDEVYQRFSSSPIQGLEAAAVTRRAKDGKNIISPPKTQYWKKLLNYIFGGFNALIWVAFIVTVLSYEPLGEPDPAVFNLGVAVLLLLVIISSSLFYALVDFHASNIMKSIKTLIAEDATVIRDGKPQTISARDVVVGDLVQISMGDRVPADVRIVSATSDLKFDRSLLTGESEMIPGTVEATSDNALETRNLALTSTFVVQGSFTGVVFAIGDNSIMGRIVSMSGTEKFKLTSVQKEVWFFTKVVSGIALAFFILSIVVWGAWIRRSFPGFETASLAIINSLGCLTAFIPQGLPICVALSLTIVARRMAKHSVLVKNLATIETLGCMSVLCSDKTGTLTTGKMTVQSVAFLGEELTVPALFEAQADGSLRLPVALRALYMIARLCNGAQFDGGADSHVPVEERAIKGDPTDTAILRFAETLSLTVTDNAINSITSGHKVIFEIRFNSRNKWMLSLVQENDTKKTYLCVKGAPDVLFGHCTSVTRADGTIVPLDDDIMAEIHATQQGWSGNGQRVLALCRRELDIIKLEGLNPEVLEEMMYEELQDLTLVGLIGIRDPPRVDVPPAIAGIALVIRRAGIRVFMVTGDFKLTAVAIAKQIGLVTVERLDTIDDMRSSELAKRYINCPPPLIAPNDDDGDRALVVTGAEIATLEPADWDMIAGCYTEIVFARTTPEQKLRIVEELKARGDNTVAVTGDGVNDAPALKGADIGIAMGSGSDVAKEAAAVILLNNSFVAIPIGIEMGRLVFDNLKKVMLYVMPAGTYTEFMAVLGSVFCGMQSSLSSYLQVCFSMTNDVVMSIPLMYEKPESDLMLRKPRNARTERLTDWRFFFQIYLFIGLMMWPCAMAMWFYWMSLQGLGFHDVIGVYNKWTDGYKGYTLDQLTHFGYNGISIDILVVTMVFMQYGGLLAVRNRRVSIINSNPLWGPRRNLVVPVSMVFTMLIAIVNLYGPGFQNVFKTAPIPAKFWGIPFGFAAGILLIDEIRKLIVRTYPQSLVAKMAWLRTISRNYYIMAQTFTPYALGTLPSKDALVKQYVGEPLEKLRTPAFVIDRAVFRKNCTRMLANAKIWGASLRTHLKTHKTVEGARLQLDEGELKTHAVVVSTLMEAWQVVQGGLVKDGTVNDILYGLPVGVNKIADLSDLWDEVAKDGAVVRLMVDHRDQIKCLEEFEKVRATPRRWSVFVKIDGGQRRAGVSTASDSFVPFLKTLFDSPAISVYGFYIHAGNAYASTTITEASSFLSSEVNAVNDAAGIALPILASSVNAHLYTSPFVLSVGSTPTAHAATPDSTVRAAVSTLNGSLELHAGNYPMNDLQQKHTTLISDEHIAQRVLATVVSHYPGRGSSGSDEALCDAGCIAMSKDTGPSGGFGDIVGRPWRLGRMSQEHGILTPTEAGAVAPKVGEMVEIVGQHACLIAAAYPWYYVVENGGRTVVDVWVPWKGW